MTSRDFCFWLQGVLEIGEADRFTREQTTIIKNHLAMVFFHEIDPSMGDTEHLGKLNLLHSGVEEISTSPVVPSTVSVPDYMDPNKKNDSGARC